MRLIRCMTGGGDVCYAAKTGKEWLKITGDPCGRFNVTNEPVSPSKRLAPVVPAAIFCIGLNYRQHAAEIGGTIPEFPILFMKSPASVQDPDHPILLPRHLRSDEVDYEAELAVVIGRDCKNATPENALDHVLGYTCANDVSARDWQLRRSGRQWCRAKSFDTFCPLGPELVTGDELQNPQGLRIQSGVNGIVLQDSNTADMIFSIAELIVFLSGSTTLKAGTVILTGTPEGVGMARNPPVWLNPGDVVEIEIEGIGILRNPVVEESKQ